MANFHFIYYTTTTILGIYLISNLAIRVVKFIKIFNLKKYLNEAIDIEIDLELKLYALLEKYYGIEKVEKLKSKEIWLGMPTELLRIAKGKEDAKKRQVSGKTTFEKFYFGKFVNRLGNTKYALEVKIRDGAVIGWKELI